MKRVDGAGMEEVPEDLLVAARTAFQNAYAPYSRFRVGAALRSIHGSISSGANIENASYGLSRCAEQSAIQAMASAGERGFSELVVYTESERPATPCGACRQILAEFSPEAVVYLVNHRGDATLTTVMQLLPGAFQLEPPV